MNIELQTIRSGYDRKTCWVHARPGVVPANPAIGVITMQQLRLSGDDVFYEIYSMHSVDGGKSWSEPAPQKTLARRDAGNNIEEGISDFWPMWHEASGTMLGTGHTIRYLDDNLAPSPRARSTAYSTYDLENHCWAQWETLKTPYENKFFNEGAGSTQRLDLPDGTILLPSYFALQQIPGRAFETEYASTVLRCAFDGRHLQYLEYGSELYIPGGRGFCEPSLTVCNNRYFLTLRNNDGAYVTTGVDGLHYDEPQRWTFDDGSDLGNYNTQQHWLTLKDDLYLIYNRRGADNDHIPRHRAPLFIAQVDQEKLCVIRNSEKVLMPERGARLCNFGVAKISDVESWVTVSEWMQTTLPNPFDCTVCEKRGSDNSIFLAKVKF